MERTSAGRRRRGGALKTGPAPEVAPPHATLFDEPDALPPDVAFPAPSAEPVVEHEPVVPLATPEPAFAARVPPPAPEPPLPASRRAIFFDVENTSHAGHIARVIEHLAIDRLGRRTEFVAVGNWRVIGQDTARLLARHGAQLVHSAPSAGVKDWSDLRIAVSAGAWLAAARPGDVLEIVSDDRAFDAVGDVAAALGIAFRRLSSLALAGAPAAAPREAEAAVGEKRQRRGRRGRRGGRAPAAAEPRRAEARHHAPAHAAPAGAGHTTPHDELVHVVRELAQRSPTGAVLIDTLSRALKARGFSRPPGSPRLVTRLRRIKELAVSPTGMITLVGEPAPAAPATVSEEHGPEPTPRRRRRRRRGGRGRRRAGAAGAAGA
ncbi:MAG: hypothetical protein HYU25_17755 [Candidatus Rokubacteria bacterium]|nr:hypothetical protein [Candidatus Rokubacteria bacterium]